MWGRLRWDAVEDKVQRTPFQWHGVGSVSLQLVERAPDGSESTAAFRAKREKGVRV